MGAETGLEYHFIVVWSLDVGLQAPRNIIVASRFEYKGAGVLPLGRSHI